MDTRLVMPARTLRIAFGLMATLAGLDKFFNILADWGSYLSPLALQVVPVPAGRSSMTELPASPDIPPVAETRKPIT